MAGVAGWAGGQGGGGGGAGQQGGGQEQDGGGLGGVGAGAELAPVPGFDLGCRSLGLRWRVMVRTWAASAQATASAAVITVAVARARAGPGWPGSAAPSAPRPVSRTPTTVMVVMARAVTVSTRASDLAGVSSAASSAQAWSARAGRADRAGHRVRVPAQTRSCGPPPCGAGAGDGHLERPGPRSGPAGQPRARVGDRRAVVFEGLFHLGGQVECVLGAGVGCRVECHRVHRGPPFVVRLAGPGPGDDAARCPGGDWLALYYCGGWGCGHCGVAGEPPAGG